MKVSKSNADREYERGLLSCVTNNESASQLVFEFFIARGSEFGVGSMPNITVALEVLTRLLQDQRQSTISNAFRAFAAGKGYFIDFEFLAAFSSQSTPLALARRDINELD